MKPEDCANAYPDKMDFSGCAHREPTKQELEWAALKSQNVIPYVTPKDYKPYKPSIFKRLFKWLLP